MDEFDCIIADFELHKPVAPKVISFFKPKVDTAREDSCPSCKIGKCVFDTQLCADICLSCGVMQYKLVEECTPNHTEVYNAPTYVPYQRQSHFREVVVQMQGKQQTTIPIKVLDDIHMEMTKRGLETLSLCQIRTILKAIKQSKYYEHAIFILEKLGQRVPHLSIELEDKLMKQFLLMQQSYQKHAKDERANFLNYYYTLYKMLEIEGRMDCLPFIPMLATRSLTAQNDTVWRNICTDLGWVYKPTV